MHYRPLGILALMLVAHSVLADVTITAPDGRKIVLRDNGTWAVAQDGDDAEARRFAQLTLEKKFDLERGCRLGLRLQNNLSAQIRSLVLRFTAFKGSDIPFETVSRGYSYIKPTASQYQEINFRGITCDEITSIQVLAARNCHVGDLTKYSADAHHCLNLVEVAVSDILPIAKGVNSD
ncbi:MAG TPA: hypothetical protein PKZ35_08975 [Gammaproteobacteria bacterium]|nr:hypothetical protein [Chromatiaceae bacterium]HPE80131.1 hypothetical protein [Gammaproteobacteria bacterium]